MLGFLEEWFKHNKMIKATACDLISEKDRREMNVMTLR